MGMLAWSQDIAIEGFSVLAMFKMLIMPDTALCPRNCKYSLLSIAAVWITGWHCGYGTNVDMPE